jgi:glycosyltransferase involved in cell wall biosynthesis
MLLRRLYYTIKPLLPLRMRLGFRRIRARRILRRDSAVWPISETARLQPDGWPGWPDGKQFAVVLTHDVERQTGLERCRHLMELEAELGFRSSFNFVPEGPYLTPKQLRDDLITNGFEVGVHDLRHDGKLYQNRSTFRDNARKINGYLKEWNAVGFRSAFMLHNFDWLQDLNVLYDASSFDTDPFEPQPDGVNTIFPFWVPRRSAVESINHESSINHSDPLNPQPQALNYPRTGYVELPYTLVQDITLFAILRQQTIEIWRQKLDWIAAYGGMVLLNTHPDYIDFENGGIRDDQFPAQLYRDLLAYIERRYHGKYWQALPKEIADYCAQFRPRRPQPARKRVCMLSYSHYEGDNRIMRYAETLQQRGDEVDVIALRDDKAKPKEVVRNVTVRRVQRRLHNEKTKLSYLARLLRFTLVSSLVLSRQHRRKAYDLIHVHNIPDFLVFSAWYPKLTGARVILDIHDIVPELYLSKFGSHRGFTYAALLLIERLSIKFADHVIISNHLWLERLASRSVSSKNCTVIVNHVDERLFYPRPRTRNDGKLVMLFPGTLQWHQGLDLAIKALAMVQHTLPQLELHICGSGDQKLALRELARDLGLQAKVFFPEPVPYDTMPGLAANADLGVVPKRADGFGNEAYSTKIMEFMSQGVPVVVSRTKIDAYYFDETVVQFFEPENVRSLADAITRVLSNEALRSSLSRNGCAYADRNGWSKKKDLYLDLADSMLS